MHFVTCNGTSTSKLRSHFRRGLSQTSKASNLMYCVDENECGVAFPSRNMRFIGRDELNSKEIRCILFTRCIFHILYSHTGTCVIVILNSRNKAGSLNIFSFTKSQNYRQAIRLTKEHYTGFIKKRNRTLECSSAFQYLVCRNHPFIIGKTRLLVFDCSPFCKS